MPSSSTLPLPPPPPPPPPPPRVAATLSPAGLGPVRIGARAADLAGGFVSDGFGSAGCETFTSPAYPGLWVMVEEGVVRRISAGGGLGRVGGIATDRGIALGAPEAAVRAAYPDLRSEPHAYVPAPGRNLYTTPAGATPGTTGLRFEIDQQGRVDQVHAGQHPQLAYLEGCA